MPSLCLVVWFQLEQIESSQREYVATAREALDQMHKQLSETNKTKRDRARSRQAKKKGVQPANFVVGDYYYVMYQDL